MPAAWREFQRGTALINRAKDYGRAHPGATEEHTLSALEAGPVKNNGLYVRAGLFLAARERESPAIAAEGGGPTRVSGPVMKEEDPQEDRSRSRPDR